MRAVCQHCNKMFRNFQELDEHVSAIHEQKRCHCPVAGCTRSYSYPKALRAHMATHQIQADSNSDHGAV